MVKHSRFNCHFDNFSGENCYTGVTAEVRPARIFASQSGYTGVTAEP